MEKLFEKAMQMDTAEAFDQIFKTQTETYGTLEIDRLASIIKANNINSVLDIGTGEGSFLLNLAKALGDVSFTGIDHNEDFLKKAVDLKKKMGTANVRLAQEFFDTNFAPDKYDMIFTRFTLQHASSPQEFVDAVYKRLNEKGIFITIDEYLFDTGIADPIWSEFYNCWISCFKKAGCNHLMSTEINPWLKRAGFNKIESSIQLYSPVTIGPDNFRTLVTRIAALLYKVYPEVWDESFFPRFEEWLERIVKMNEINPFIPMAHVIAKK